MKSLIIANWKCNPATLAEAKKLFSRVKSASRRIGAIICAPFIYLPEFKSNNLCAQNCHWENSGPYTGEVSPKMLKNSGIKYVLVGHSERRIHFKETDEMINKKLKAALDAGLTPVLCIGEKRGESAEKIIEVQLKNDLKGIAYRKLNKIVIAYEPVWAIGTGDFCETKKASKALKFIKSKIRNKVLYGGSVNSKIAKNYIDVGFDGLLVGGASLNADEFIKIVKNG